MINRDISSELDILLTEYPVITILGPRQAGKTTLAQNALPEYEYCNLESPDERAFAEEDPVAFLDQFKQNVIIDEIQRVPKLLNYIQVRVDKNRINGEFVLTGSHQLELSAAITQSLAGRTAIIKLLPLSIAELSRTQLEFKNFEEYCFQGFMPRIIDQKQRPQIAYSNYYQTYVERDVRALINIKDISLFEKFIKLLAGRIGQLINYSSLANDVGVNSSTVKNWLSILEASYIIYKLPPYYDNFGKRQIKNPKYYFIDVGLLVYLLGIRNPFQISRDPLVGNIFENLVIIEILKNQLNEGKVGDFYFYRESNGTEIDLIFQDNRVLNGIEIKSNATFNASYFKPLEKLKTLSKTSMNISVIYNGKNKILSGNKQLLNFKDSYKVLKN